MSSTSAASAAAVAGASPVPAGAGAHAFDAHEHQRSARDTWAKAQRKVTIVGAGSVGAACAVSILSQRLCSELCLIDIDTAKVTAEVLDLQHGMGASSMPVKVYGGADMALTRNSHLCIVAAGVRQRVGESRPELLNRNARLLTPVFQQLVAQSPDAVLLVISNPVDAMTYLAWRVTGLPAGRVFGSGTILDTSRFRLLLAERLHMPIPAVHAHVIGEHGDASVPLWSLANIFGTPLRALYPDAARPNDRDDFVAISQRVVTAAAELIKLKGYTAWGIGLCCAALARNVLHDEPAIVSVCTIVPAGHRLCAPATDSKGKGAKAVVAGAGCSAFELKEPVAMSLPCQVDARGVRAIVKIAIDAQETAALQVTANKLIELQNLIDFAALPKPAPLPVPAPVPMPAPAAAAKAKSAAVLSSKL